MFNFIADHKILNLTRTRTEFKLAGRTGDTEEVSNSVHIEYVFFTSKNKIIQMFEFKKLYSLSSGLLMKKNHPELGNLVFHVRSYKIYKTFYIPAVKQPFILGVYTDSTTSLAPASSVPTTGFNLDYTQLPC